MSDLEEQSSENQLVDFQLDLKKINTKLCPSHRHFYSNS